MDKTIAQRQRNRRQRLKDFARSIGFLSWAAMETAILSGKATVTVTDAANGRSAPTEPPQPEPPVTVTRPAVSVLNIDTNRRYAWLATPDGDSLVVRRRTRTIVPLRAGEFAGYATTRAAAERAGLNALGVASARWFVGSFAEQWHNAQIRERKGASSQHFQERREEEQATAERVANRRSANPSPETGSRPTEFVYRSNFALDGLSVHRVIKKTAKKIFVYSAAWGYLDEGTDQVRQCAEFAGKKTHVIDRAVFEQTGEWGSADGKFDYYAQIPAWFLRQNAQTPPFVAALGLKMPCTVADIKAAYREMAKAAHPDAGGDHAKFIELQATYERALRYVGK